MKKEYLKFIKEFSKIKIKPICEELLIDYSNIMNGRASEQTTSMLYNEIIKRLKELLESKGE